jgi:hypothetical protein
VVVSVTSCGFKEMLACSVPNVLSWIQVCAFDECRSGFCGATLKTISYLASILVPGELLLYPELGKNLFSVHISCLISLAQVFLTCTKDAGCISACEMWYAAES